jgi:hypothetical protein
VTPSQTVACSIDYRPLKLTQMSQSLPSQAA